MLSLLHIENIALIEEADIVFHGGLNVLTGETGAGKSIVIDAIGAIIGERTSRDLIRTGAGSALVSAVFTDLPPLPWFEENGICPDENGELLLTRELQSDGKNICRAGGKPCTVAQLKALGARLVNIHGQHDGQQLLDEGSHLAYLDRFGDHRKAYEAFDAAYQELSRLRHKIESLQMDEAERQRQMDTLKYQIGELERADLCVGEDEVLAARRELLRNAGKLTELAQRAHFALSGDDDSAGAASLFDAAEGYLSDGSRYSESFSKLMEKAAEIRCEVEDLAESVRDLRDDLDFSPGELDQVEERLDLLHRLQKKYGSTVEEMLDYLARCREELDGMECAADTLEQLAKEYESTLKQTKQAAQVLSEARKTAAGRLIGRVKGELEQLDMPKVRFEVEFSPKGGEIAMDATGMDEVRFLMSANLGEELKPIAKVASGGELARIMLALKNVLAEKDDVTTLIFDEVDTGVSGRAAQRVGEKMSDIAGYVQVLCVTHLPQIAALADTHFAVEKGEREGRTYTRVVHLGEEERKNELARLTSGEHITPAALESAAELLHYAFEHKKPQKKGEGR